MKNEEVFYNEWISLRKITNVRSGIRGYYYSHETRCNGEIVALLPYRRTIRARGEYPVREYLLKSEVTPCWDTKKPILSTITGGKDSDYAKLDAVKELLEETGYQIIYRELIELGTSRASKSSDTIYHLFSVDLTNKEQGEILGDGSELEKRAKAVWVDKKKILECGDPQASVMYLRLKMATGGGL